MASELLASSKPAHLLDGGLYLEDFWRFKERATSERFQGVLDDDDSGIDNDGDFFNGWI